MLKFTRIPAGSTTCLTIAYTKKWAQQKNTRWFWRLRKDKSGASHKDDPSVDRKKVFFQFQSSV